MNNDATPILTFDAKVEKQLVRPRGGSRHILVRVAAGQQVQETDRTSLSLALVIDRSGSMSGPELETAKAAALAVIKRLDERDQAAVVVFDSEIDVVQPPGPVTQEVKTHVSAALGQIQARSSTALHEGWLTGCNAIARVLELQTTPTIAHCFLLTDGQANVGETDPERIAEDAAGIRRHGRITTSTFGIGPAYNESLLAPMAVAGGGQFHHLHSTDDILSTFAGELDNLFSIAAQQVRVEIETPSKVETRVISQYWTEQAGPDMQRHAIAIGDLTSAEERQIIVRFQLPYGRIGDDAQIRTRLVWREDNIERSTQWQPVHFTYASHEDCNAEERDAEVMRQVGLSYAARARSEAAKRSAQGDIRGSRQALRGVASRIAQYAGDDAALNESVAELSSLEDELRSAPLPPMVAKEVAFNAQRMSRGQRDYRKRDN